MRYSNLDEALFDTTKVTGLHTYPSPWTHFSTHSGSEMVPGEKIILLKCCYLYTNIDSISFVEGVSTTSSLTWEDEPAPSQCVARIHCLATCSH